MKNSQYVSISLKLAAIFAVPIVFLLIIVNKTAFHNYKIFDALHSRGIRSYAHVYGHSSWRCYKGNCWITQYYKYPAWNPRTQRTEEFMGSASFQEDNRIAFAVAYDKQNPAMSWPNENDSVIKGSPRTYVRNIAIIDILLVVVPFALSFLIGLWARKKSLEPKRDAFGN